MNRKLSVIVILNLVLIIFSSCDYYHKALLGNGTTTYQLHIKVYPENSGKIIIPETSPIEVQEGESVVVKAQTYTGYEFVNWSCDNSEVIIDDEFNIETTVTLKNGDAIVFANFKSNTQPTIYAATSTEGLSISYDGGMNWLNIVNQFNSNNLICVYAKYSNIYIGHDTGLEVSKDSGETWTYFDLTSSSTETHVNSVYGDGINIIVGKSDGVHISNDSGNSWSQYTTAEGLLQDNVFDVFYYNSTLYVGIHGDVAGSGGLSISFDWGASWTNYDDSNFGSPSVWNVYAKDSNIFVTCNPGGLSMSNNSGSTWVTYTSTDLSSDEVTDVYLSNEKLYVTTSSGGLNISEDWGASWEHYSHPDLTSNSLNSVVVKDDDIYLGSWSNGVYVSLDDGNTWINYNTNNTNILSNAISMIYVD